eukprot:498771-Pyramimonas_sp.AAC.2
MWLAKQDATKNARQTRNAARTGERVQRIVAYGNTPVPRCEAGQHMRVASGPVEPTGWSKT